MDILSEVYYKSAVENERNFRFWENYLQSLKSLDFSIYSDKLKVPTLVPIGSRISFRGELKHTNEVTVALGADYFVKCSLKQAEVLRQHRIKDAQSKVDMFNKEKEYLENQMSFTHKAIYDNQGKEIIEYCSEEDDKAWRQAHRERNRKYKQNKGKEEKDQAEVVPDEELWNRLEELELQEELENELSNEQDDNIDNQHLTKRKASIQEYLIDEVEDYIKLKNDEIENEKIHPKKSDNEKNTKTKKEVTFKEIETPEQASKLDKLQQVIDKQNDLEEKLFELKNRERSQTKNETDLMSRLDELEQLDELEDEMDRLDDIIENEDVEEEEEKDTNETQAPKLQRRVSFVDEDDSETLEITFKHSPTESHNEPYNPKKGIKKPSDIYVAHSKLFGNGNTSILKKSKYEAVTEKSDTKASQERVVQFDTQIQNPSDNYVAHSKLFGNETKSILKKSKYAAVTEKSDAKTSHERVEQFDNQDNTEPETIVVKDVVEKVTQADLKLISQARPSSLFKKKRMQNKSNKS